MRKAEGGWYIYRFSYFLPPFEGRVERVGFGCHCAVLRLDCCFDGGLLP